MTSRIETERASSVLAGEASGAAALDLSKRRRQGEIVIQGILFFCGFVSIFTTLGIVFVLGEESINFFKEINLFDFLTGTKWIPNVGKFGILPLITATLMSSTIAICVALPLGLGSAIYLSEYASEGVRKTLKPILEILAGIPTVVYGYFALTFITPILRSIFGPDNVEIFNTGAAGLVMGVMILPMVASMSEDALSAVPNVLREASYGLGATKYETSVKVVVPGALSGIIAAFIIAVSRAVGETMIVAIAAGAGPALTANPFEGAQTMTGYIAAISGGETSYGTPDYNSIFAIGLTLFVITLSLNILSRLLVNRYREVYE